MTQVGCDEQAASEEPGPGLEAGAPIKEGEAAGQARTASAGAA